MLKDTNVDAIKLDMKLIDMNQQNRSKGVQIVESVVDMAHRLNLPIIAEGVETPEQVSMLQAADCCIRRAIISTSPCRWRTPRPCWPSPTARITGICAAT